MGFLDKQIMPGNGGLLDPMLERYMQQQRQQQFWGLLSQVGQGIMAANRGGQPPLRALSAGLARGRPAGGQDLGGLLGWMKMREYGRERAQEQDKASRYANLVGGLDPKTGIDWNTGRVQGQAPTTQLASSGAAPGAPGGGLLDLQSRTVPGRLGFSPEQQRLLRAMGPKEGLGLLADQAFPKALKYGAPVTVTKDGDPTLVRFPQGLGAPVPVQGYSPYTKPGEGPAIVQTADAYRLASKQAGVTVSQLEALQWARTSVSKSPSDIFLSIYNSLVRGFASPEEAKSTAEQMARYIIGIRAGGLQGGPEPLPPPGASESGDTRSLYERGKEFLGFTNDPAAAQAATRPGAADNPLIPRRKPSLAGVRLPLASSGFDSAGEDPTVARLPLNALTPAQKLQRMGEQRPGRLQEPSRRGPAREIDAPKRPLPRTAAGKVDARRLKRGQVYEASDLTLWRWDGQGFTEVAE